MNTPLQVYRASAGSGKTFRIALEYLKLVLTKDYAHQYILAVSFTNKATGEMKARILEVLHGISKGHSNVDSYLEYLQAELGKSRKEIQDRAQIALSRILHDYNRFNIETIDSFNQRVLRNLTKELGLSAYFNIDLDSTKAASEAVDQLIANLDENSSSLTWISNFMEEKERDEKSAREVEKEIKEFSTKIFSETFKVHQPEIKAFFEDRNKVETYIRQIQLLKKEENNKIKKLSDGFDKIKSENNLEFPSKSVAGFFIKIREGKTLTDIQREKLLQGNLTWFTALTYKSNPSYKNIEDTLLTPYLLHSLGVFEQAIHKINSCNLILKHIRSMALLEEIASELKLINEEKNRFLLADTTPLLHGLIGDSDTSFIYEKIGSNIKHLMIDEFQDTSSMEWKNFKLLLTENIANGNNNLIVGDVKQSIYRWRNSNWETLNNIENEFSKSSICIHSLNTNYRTYSSIVTFNNELFALATQKLNHYCKEEILNAEGRSKMLHAYEDVAQKSPPNKENKGYVKVCCIDKKEKKSPDISPHLIELIKDLKKDNIQSKEITILVRKKSEISKISQAFHDHILNFPEDQDFFHLVSDEAFKLKASSAIQLIIFALTYLSNPKDNLAKAQLAYIYQKDILGKDSSILQNLIRIDDFLPEEFIKNGKALALIPLYDLTEKLIYYFHLGEKKSQYGYLYYFLDAQQKFLKSNTADIKLFLNYWEEILADKTISIDGDIPGIRIMTIHKSKGLEFEHVIVPYCNWTLDKTSHENLIWTKENFEDAQNPCPLFPINYNDSGISKSIFINDYAQETLKLWVDNLNLLYVTFTRPKKSLFIFIDKESANNKILKVSDLIAQCIPQITGGTTTYPNLNDVLWIWEKGSISFETPKDSQKQDNNACSIGFLTHKTPIQYHLSKEAQQFLQTWNTDENYAQKRGKIFHKLLEYIPTINETENAIQKLIIEGYILEKEKSFYQTTLNELFQNPYAQNWFSGKYNLYKERNITYLKNNEIISNRPDRVMVDEIGNTIIVDYKTGKKNKKYHEQINQYKNVLQAMNYKNIKGYIWYLDSNQVEEV